MMPLEEVFQQARRICFFILPVSLAHKDCRLLAVQRLAGACRSRRRCPCSHNYFPHLEALAWRQMVTGTDSRAPIFCTTS